MTIDHRSQDRLKICRTGQGVEIFWLWAFLPEVIFRPGLRAEYFS